MKYIIVFISIFLDIFLLNFINIQYLYPMFTITSISFVNKFFNKNNYKKYYILLFFSSIVYDVLIINNIFLTIALFFIIGKINLYFNKTLKDNIINNIFKVIFSIIIYDISFYTILTIVGYYKFNINLLYFKIINSIILNIIYSIILFLVLKKDKH